MIFVFFQSVDIENGQTSVQPTTLRTNPMYVVYYNFWIKTLVTELFPYGVLIFLSGCIYREIRRSVKRQQAMRCTQPQKEEIKSANVVVSFIFISFFYLFIFKIYLTQKLTLTNEKSQELEQDGEDRHLA